MKSLSAFVTGIEKTGDGPFFRMDFGASVVLVAVVGVSVAVVGAVTSVVFDVAETFA